MAVSPEVVKFDNPVELYNAIVAGKVPERTIVEVWGNAVFADFRKIEHRKSSTEISNVQCTDPRFVELFPANTIKGGDRIGFKGTLGSTRLTASQTVSITELRNCVILFPEIGPVTQWFENTVDLDNAAATG